MPQSYDRIIIHTLFSTKYRQPFIDLEIEPGLHKVICAEFLEFNCKVLEIGGTDDHVHIIHTLPRTVALCKVLNAVKSISSGWIKTKGEQYEWFGWQDGYTSLSADYRKLEGLLSYVRKQRDHHGINSKKLSFRSEQTNILTKFGYPDFNPKYQFPDPPEGWGGGSWQSV